MEEYNKIKGFNKLSDFAQITFKRIYERHQSGFSKENKPDWEAVKVEETHSHLKVYFKNGEWLHYYPNGTWG